ncbi:MAG: hypothetical protein SFV54_23625 [Bryobacteraceae bacterium]|nr:hypothetical protein [Bryobacteraceae bacterium]
MSSHGTAARARQAFSRVELPAGVIARLPYHLLVMCALLCAPVSASFIAPYSVDSFTLTNTGADGTFATLDGGLTAVLTGGNSGSGFPGMTDATIAATVAGTVRFRWSYFSLDEPTYDFAGYILDGEFTLLANATGFFGNVVLPVTAGQVFGFRVSTWDNTFEPGILTISDFSGPGAAVSGVPEPATGAMVLMAAAAAVLLGRARGRGAR